jgi:hypothetical protein
MARTWESTWLIACGVLGVSPYWFEAHELVLFDLGLAGSWVKLGVRTVRYLGYRQSSAPSILRQAACIGWARRVFRLPIECSCACQTNSTTAQRNNNAWSHLVLTGRLALIASAISALLVCAKSWMLLE